MAVREIPAENILYVSMHKKLQYRQNPPVAVGIEWKVPGWGVCVFDWKHSHITQVKIHQTARKGHINTVD